MIGWMKHRVLWMALTIALLPTLARAQENKPDPIVTDRPDFTESAEVVPFQQLQLEGGYTFTRISRDREHTLGEFLLRVTTGRRTEFRAGLNSYTVTRSPSGHASGMEDISLGLKVKLMDGDERFGLSRPHVALIAATTLPTGASSYRENNWQPEVKFCFGWDLSERLALSSNLNYAYASEGGAQFSQFSGSLSFGYGLTERLGTYLEYFGFVPASKGGPNAGYLNGGVTYLVHNDYQLDLRAGIGLNSPQPDYFVGVGAAHRW